MLIKLFCWLLEELFSGAGIMRVWVFQLCWSLFNPIIPPFIGCFTPDTGGLVLRNAGFMADLIASCCRSCSS